MALSWLSCTPTAEIRRRHDPAGRRRRVARARRCDRGADQTAGRRRRGEHVLARAAGRHPSGDLRQRGGQAVADSLTQTIGASVPLLGQIPPTPGCGRAVTAARRSSCPRRRRPRPWRYAPSPTVWPPAPAGCPGGRWGSPERPLSQLALTSPRLPASQVALCVPGRRTGGVDIRDRRAVKRLVSGGRGRDRRHSACGHLVGHGLGGPIGQASRTIRRGSYCRGS